MQFRPHDRQNKSTTRDTNNQPPWATGKNPFTLLAQPHLEQLPVGQPTPQNETNNNKTINPALLHRINHRPQHQTRIRHIPAMALRERPGQTFASEPGPSADCNLPPTLRNRTNSLSHAPNMTLTSVQCSKHCNKNGLFHSLAHRGGTGYLFRTNIKHSIKTMIWKQKQFKSAC
jgi:hypothetical protein